MAKLTYKFDWNTIKENARNRHQQKMHIRSIKDAVMNAVNAGLMDDPYKKYNEMQGKTAETSLHASRGKKLQLEEQRNVLEIDVGGSGYKQLRADYAKLGGKNNISENNAKVSIEKINKGKKQTIHWWNKIGLFQLLPSFLRPKSADKIKQQNAIIEQYGTNVVGHERKEGQQSKADYLFEQRYGKHSNAEGLKDKKHIYVKEEPLIYPDGPAIRKTRYSMPGPLGTIMGMGSGLSNSGTYSINNTSNYILDAAKDFLKPIIAEWKQIEADALSVFNGNTDPNMSMEDRLKKADQIREKLHPVTISLKGHSRGGIAVSHGAMKIKEWIHQTYPQYEKYIQFDLLQLDPVAGFGSDHGIKRNINIQNETRPELQAELKERKMRSLGDSGNTTVVYSLHTNHDHFFSPQIVDGAKRIILLPEKHSVYLKNVDTSQKDSPFDKNHRQSYMDASTGEMYRSSGLNELPEGIYIADENNRLIKIPNLETGRAILQDVLKDTKGQKGRHNRLDEVMGNWFTAHNKAKEKDKPMERAKTNISELENASKNIPQERRSLSSDHRPQLEKEQPEKKRSMSIGH